MSALRDEHQEKATEAAERYLQAAMRAQTQEAWRRQRVASRVAAWYLWGALFYNERDFR